MLNSEWPRPTEPSAPLTGTVLAGRYELTAVIASGGMATVYRGFDHRLRRTVAVKIMSSHLAADPSLIKRFEREAQSMARLSHPGVVAVHDHGIDAGHFYLIMELVDGGNLRDVLRESGALPIPEAIAVLAAVLHALAHAHAEGLIHRDIKPENILVSSTGAVKLTDFGLVRTALTETMATGDAILGTVAYMAPEQIATGHTDTRTDVYSLGIVAFEMLTGSRPFTGDNPFSIAYQHVHADVPPPSSRRSGIAEPLDHLVQRATHRQPTVRPNDAGAFRAAVDTTARALQIPAIGVRPPVTRQPPDSRTAAGTPPATAYGTRRAADMPLTAYQPPLTPTRLLPTVDASTGLRSHSNQYRRARRRIAGAIVVLLAGTVAVVAAAQRPSTSSPIPASQPASSTSSKTPAPADQASTVSTTSSSTTPPTSRTARQTVESSIPARTSTARPTRPTSTSAVQTTEQISDHWLEGPNRIGDGTAPAFPSSLAGWRLNQQWDLTDRAFEGLWTDISGPDYTDFPSTMNGCDNQRFLVRWRAVNDSATITAVWADSINNVHAEVNGSAGWFDLDGCAHPAITLKESSDGSTLSDVAVSVQQYWPAA